MTAAVAFSVEKAFEVNEKSAVLRALKAAGKYDSLIRRIGRALRLMRAVQVYVVKHPSPHNYKSLAVLLSLAAAKVFYICRAVLALELTYSKEILVFVAGKRFVFFIVFHPAKRAEVLLKLGFGYFFIISISYL